MARNHEIVVRFSKEELEKVRKKSEDLGLTISSFIRFIALKSEIKLEVSR